jgi:hypothetical protein
LCFEILSMKTPHSFILTILSASCFIASGQVDQSKPVKAISVSEFYLLPTFLRFQQTFATLEEFRSLAPKSILLNRDLTAFSPSGNFFYGGSSSASILLGVKLRNKASTDYRKSSALRIGFTCISSSLLSSGLYARSDDRTDTLVSSQTGRTIYVDSLIWRHYDMEYRSQQLRLDCSVVFRTDPEMRWSLFAGIGLTGGYSIDTNTKISYSERKAIEYEQNGGYESQFNFLNVPRFSLSYRSQSEQFTNRNCFSMSTYIPMGVDFRLGKKRSFWKMTHLFYELRPGVNFTFISELRTFASTSMQHGLGLKMAW